MGEVRKDYLLDRYVIIASERGKRPHEFAQHAGPSASSVAPKKTCAFCPGQERNTPDEVLRINDAKGNWRMRVFPNKFGAVHPQGNAQIRTDNDFFTFSNNFGYAEVLIETPQHGKEIADLPIEDLSTVLRLYQERITALSAKEGVRYVTVFKNSGGAAGTSLEHTHSQIIAFNHNPRVVEREVGACHRYAMDKPEGTCAYCDIITIERQSDRHCFENNAAVAFAPYASRFPFELWIFPKRHVHSLINLTDAERQGVAELLSSALKRLKTINAPYNYYLHYAPTGDDLHFHIELTPRTEIWAGFELSTETIINVLSPEDAAKFYRGE